MVVLDVWSQTKRLLPTDQQQYTSRWLKPLLCLLWSPKELTNRFQDTACKRRDKPSPLYKLHAWLNLNPNLGVADHTKTSGQYGKTNIWWTENGCKKTWFTLTLYNWNNKDFMLQRSVCCLFTPGFVKWDLKQVRLHSQLKDFYLFYNKEEDGVCIFWVLETCLL